MTQPPMLAIATEAVANALPATDRRAFTAQMLPAIINFHTWIYRERDPHHTGLAACLHSWECGLDDTPYWTDAMNALRPLPWRWRWLREFRPAKPEERARPTDLKHMLTLAYLMKQARFDSATLLRTSPVVIQDLIFNAILAAANESLERLADAADQDLPPQLTHAAATTRRALETLWDHDTEQYYSRQLVDPAQLSRAEPAAPSGHAGRLLTTPSIATVMPLFAGTASLARARHLRDLITAPGSSYATPYPLPTVPPTSPAFEPQRFWRGPVWLSTNWFAIRGLQRYGFTTEANHLRQQTLSLVQSAGFREYFNPLTGDGLGAQNFSWTAALTLDLLARA